MPDRRTQWRLRTAIGMSRRWYEMVFALQKKRFGCADGIWVALDEPPPFHSAAMTLRPSLSPDAVAAEVARPTTHSVADTFADVPLDAAGYELLFEATWVYAAVPARPTAQPPNWSVIATPTELDAWSVAHDYVGVLPPDVLTLPEVKVLARHQNGRITAGAVLHAGEAAVGLSNVWSEPGHDLNWSEVLATAWSIHPESDLVGYENGRDLSAALSAGFTGLGLHRVWVHPGSNA
jgi:hypothetical protein